MRALIALACFAVLAACGADGQPTAPAAKAPATGLTLTGDVEMGVARDGGQ